MTYHIAGIAPPKRGEIVCRHHDLLISKGTKSYLNEATTSGYGKKYTRVIVISDFFKNQNGLCISQLSGTL